MDPTIRKENEFMSSGPKEAATGVVEEVKGRAKEAVGGLTGDKDLESEGKVDRRAGEAKEKLGHANEKIHEIVDKADEKVEEMIDKSKDALHHK